MGRERQNRGQGGDNGHRAPIGGAFVSFATAVVAVFVLAVIAPQLDGVVFRDRELAERLGLVGATVFGVAATLTAHRAVAARSITLISIGAVLAAGAGWSWSTFATGPATGRAITTAATVVAAVLAVALLTEGLWRARWLGVFCGLGAVGMTLAATLVRSEQRDAGSVPLALLVAISAMTCLYGILVEIEGGEQQNGKQLRAAKRRIEAEIHRNEELLHDLRSGLLSIEVAIATVDSDLAPPLQAEAARLRRLTLPTVLAGGADGGFDLVPGLAALVAARQAAGQPVEFRSPPTMPVRGRQDEVLAVVENLLSNAHRHGRAPVIVEVAKAHDEGRPESITVTVSDGGGRLPAPVLARRPMRGFSTHPRGQGLGLARARRLAAGNGGWIAARLTAEGRTEFVLSLTALEPVPPALSRPERPVGPGADVVGRLVP